MFAAFRDHSGAAVDTTRLGGSNVYHFGGTGPELTYDASGLATLGWSEAGGGLFVTTGRVAGNQR